MRPRIRTIKPEVWTDESVGRLSHGARLLYVGLITMADDEGRFRAVTSGIVGHIFHYEGVEATPEIPGWIAEIRKTSAVLFYKADRLPYGAFRHWAKHQRINRPSPSEFPPPPDKRVVFENGLVEVETLKGMVWKQRATAAPDSLRDSSMNCPGVLMEHFPSRSDPDPVVVRLSEQLSERVRANDPKTHTDPLSERWLTDMRLLLKDRDGDEAEVARIINWCQADSFWRSNILSPGKLRKQFTQLLLKAQATDAPRPAQTSVVSSLHQKLNAAETARRESA